MAIRRRPTTEFEATQQERQRQTLTLGGLTGGYNGYTDPTLLSPQMWTAANNVYSGLFGSIRRARWAPLINSSTSGYTPTTVRMTSIYGTYLPQQNPWWFFDTNMQIWKWDAVTHTASQLTGFFYLPAWNLTGPFQRLGLGGMIFQTNGSARSKMVINIAGSTPFLELDGIDAPDAAPQVTLSAAQTATLLASPNGASRTSGVITFTANAALPAGFIVGAYVTVSGVTDTSFNSPAGTSFQIVTVSSPSFTVNQVGPNATSGSGTASLSITKATGRSYQFAWENVNTGHISAPSPATQFVAYSAQTGSISCTEPGTINYSAVSTAVVGTNTFFSSAWVGRILWGAATGRLGNYIASVTDATHLTLSSNPSNTNASDTFTVFDQQATHLRLYATADGGATYFRIARNIWSSVSNYSAANPVFIDTANSEPPNAPFTAELAQNQNVPPPITQFQDQYQGRRIVYGVAAAPQSFFYSNNETTVYGQPPESFAPLNEVTLPIGDGSLYGTANLPTGFILWSNRHDMFKLTGSLTDNTVANAQQLGATIQRLPYQIGCASPYATTVTSLGTFWLSSDREVWLFTDHYAPKNVGKPIQDILNRATRIQFARMKNYKAGDRNWLALALSLDSSAFNNQLCLLDLDLLASNGQPSFFTFDMATNQPSWYLYGVNCEALETAFDANSINHLVVGDVDLITDVDWKPTYYTVGAEQTVSSPAVTLHAIGNQDPEMVKTGAWMRVLTNQLPKNLSSQGWVWNVLSYDDDKYIVGVNSKSTPCIPGANNSSAVFGLEYSPALFKWGGVNVVKGRRFQIQAQFPTTPGLWEFRGVQFAYDPVAEG